ncbi:MAG TPA: hypothetical protein VIX14_10915 [Terriglobales bacterium]
MTDNRAPSEKQQQIGNAGKDKTPAFRHERVFETQALSCGKVGTTQQLCQVRQKSS